MAIAVPGNAAEDRRLAAAVYGESTHVYKTSWPADDDLDFYLAVHALYVVAGYLIRRLRVNRHSDVPDDEYTLWLSRHLPLRSDGRWLADRRDSPPPDGRLDDEDGSTQAPDPQGWVFTLAKRDLEDLLIDENGAIVVWGSWTDRSYRRHQRCDVRSALVDPTTSSSLLVALQTSTTTPFLPLPDPGEEQAGAEPEFRIETWLDAMGEGSESADSRDPHAGSVSYPPPRPNEQTQIRMGLSAGPDMRVWSRSDDIAVFSSRVWSDEDHDGRGTSGSRLSITQVALQGFLVSSGRNLLVEVHVKRDVDHQYDRKRDGNERYSYFQPSTKFYLLDRSGGWFEYP